MNESEVRTFPLAELRYLGEDDRPAIVGKSIVYDALSEDLGGFRERFAPGSVQLDDDLLALFDHDTSMVLGRTSAGTLEATNGPEGVEMRAYPPDTTWARDMRVSMDRGDIRHMSFRFLALDDEMSLVDGQVVRTVKAAQVSELSVVAMPAYTQTSAEARSRADALRELPAEAAEPEIAETEEPKATSVQLAGGTVFDWE